MSAARHCPITITAPVQHPPVFADNGARAEVALGSASVAAEGGVIDRQVSVPVVDGPGIVAGVVGERALIQREGAPVVDAAAVGAVAGIISPVAISNVEIGESDAWRAG